MIASFLDRIRRGLPLVIYGDGRQYRDFVHVYDVARANLLALHAPKAHAVYNVGTGKPTRIIDLAKIMARLAGVYLELEFDPPRAGDIRESVADISLIRQELGFEPRINLETGLAEMSRTRAPRSSPRPRPSRNPPPA